MTTATLTVSERYETGRSDGYADGSECVLWTGGTGARGYGSARYKGRNYSAHRVAWLKAGREIPAGHALHHKCGNQLCVNLNHLQPMTPSAHTLVHHPRQEVCGRCGSDDWRIQRDGTRNCRPCANARSNAQRRERYRNEPEYRERVKARVREWKQAKRRERNAQ